MKRAFYSSFLGVLVLCFLVAAAQSESAGLEQETTSVFRLSSEIENLVPRGVTVEKIAGGFQFTEGPVWVPAHNERSARLLFSDIPADRVYRLDPETLYVRVVIEPIKLKQLSTGGVGGSNGLTLDLQGRLVLFEHGNRRVARLEQDGSRCSLVERFLYKRLNSPNDGVYHSSGALFFTDPPYGLPQKDQDAAKELNHNGIYRLDPDGSLYLLGELKRPNGIGLSPDETVLYVSNSDRSDKCWMSYQIREDLTFENGQVFFDANDLKEPGVPDGFDVDQKGNLWASGPGGVLLLSPDGYHLGTIRLPEIPSNTTFDSEETTLYITARSGVYRVRLKD